MDLQELGDIRRCFGCPTPLPPDAAKQRRYCSAACRQRAKDQRKNRETPQNRGNQSSVRSRRPLPVAAKDAAWQLRRDVERLERVCADDRFPAHKQQVAAHVRGHLKYAAEVCQDLLSRLDTEG